MQISVLPISIPGRPGVPSVDPDESLAFTDVLDGLPTEPGRPESVKAAEDGSSDLPTDTPKTAGTEKADPQSEAAPLVVESATVAPAPKPIAAPNQFVKATLPEQLTSLRAGVWANQTETHSSVGPNTAAVTQDTGVEAAPPSDKVVPLPGTPAPKAVSVPTGTATPLIAETDLQAKPQPIVPEAVPVAPGDTDLPQKAIVLTPSVETASKAPAVSSPPTVPLADTSTQAVQPKTDMPPKDPKVVLSAEPAPPLPDPLLAPSHKSPAVQPAIQTVSILTAGADPAPIVVIEDKTLAAKTVVQQVPVPSTDNIRPERTVTAEDVFMAPPSKPAGQPSRTSAIQMLTRNDLAPVKGVAQALVPTPAVVQLLRTGYQEDATQISTPQPKVALGTDPGISISLQPIPSATSVFFPGKSVSGAGVPPAGRDDAEATMMPLAPKSAAPHAVVPASPPPHSVLPKPAATPPLVTDLATEGVRPTAVPDMMLLPAAPGSPPSFAGGSQPLATVTPQNLGQAIVQVVQKGEDRQIDLALRPEELGRLRFEMSTSGDKVHVTLFIERPEALDLIRRHAEHLLNDLRQAGFSQSSLSFGDWSQRESQTGGDPAATAPTGDTADTPTMVPAERFSPVTAFGRLDIRL